jgi:C4-dicarboxylate-specific signal transduction histidine kinase
MPCAVNETAAVPATASSQRLHPDAAPDIIAEEPERAWSAAEQLASVSEPRGHETQTELTSANRVAFLGQLSASIAEINQPISAVVMNAEAALRLLLAQPTDTDAIRQLLACIVEDGLRSGDIANRTRALIKDATRRECLEEAVASLTGVDAN